jgi:beta-lactam-binding protein with PASTA domain
VPSVKKILLHLLGMIITLCFLAFFTFKVILPIVTKHNETLVMPDILGLYPEDVKSILKENNLNFKIIENNIYTLSYPANSIIEQNPIPDSIIKYGRTVYVKLNPPHPPLIKIPRLIDKSIRNVYSILQSLGIQIGKILYVTDIADNVIINAYTNSQPLHDNEEIPLGSVVDLVVGVNKLETEIPDFSGINGAEIELRLLENKLKLGTIKFLNSDSVNFEKGIVIEQSQKNKYVHCGTAIDIVLDEPKIEEPKEEEGSEENNMTSAENKEI